VAVPLVVADLLQVVVGPLQRGVVDEDVDAPKCANGLVDDARAVRRIRQIALDERRLAVLLFDPAGCLGCVVVLFEI
jgi:hypothetical protein